MRLAVLFSGGKDSTFAVHLAKQAGHEVVFLLAMQPEASDSFLFHVPNIEWTKLQAEAMGIPLVIVKTSGKKTREYLDLKTALKELKAKTKIEGLVTGAVFSTYQSSRMQTIASELGLLCFNPLWQNNPRAHWHELLLNGFEIMMVSVAAHGLDKKWLGRVMDERNLPELYALEKKYGVSSIGEGGEFESFVLNAPLFRKKIVVTKFSDAWNGLQGTRRIEAARLVSGKKGKGGAK